MENILKKINKKEAVFILAFICAMIFLIFLPTGFEKQIYVNAEGVKAKVLEVNDSAVYSNGLIKQGAQNCRILVLTGSHKGETVDAQNLYVGKLEFDKTFSVGDIAWVLLDKDEGNNIIYANMVEHYRIDKEIALIAIFAILIIIFSGFTGVRTLLSFAFALLCIWKLLIPGLLHDINPMLVALLVGNMITVATLLLVAGFTPKAFCAITGAVCCSLLTCLAAEIWGRIFNIHGAVMQWSESLLYSGFEHLDLTSIFQAGIYLACSGAVLDLSIDIAAALDEIALKSPSISRRELILSGLTIGKAVMGSQTTTLLLAYMGGYISVMMVYMAQGTPMLNIFNSKSIAAEILQTFVGCIGLVLVSPITAGVCGLVYKRKPVKA